MRKYLSLISLCSIKYEWVAYLSYVSLLWRWIWGHFWINSVIVCYYRFIFISQTDFFLNFDFFDSGAVHKCSVSSAKHPKKIAVNRNWQFVITYMKTIDYTLFYIYLYLQLLTNVLFFFLVLQAGRQRPLWTDTKVRLYIFYSFAHSLSSLRPYPQWGMQCISRLRAKHWLHRQAF